MLLPPEHALAHGIERERDDHRKHGEPAQADEREPASRMLRAFGLHRHALGMRAIAAADRNDADLDIPVVDHADAGDGIE